MIIIAIFHDQIIIDDDYKGDYMANSNHIWNILDTIKVIRFITSVLSGVLCIIFYISKCCCK